MTIPLISCVTVTYNRATRHPYLLDECVGSFLSQDHTNKELIILNDTPGQLLTCEHPSVCILNSPRRYRTMGEKLNAAFGLAQGEYVCRVDDDDINLPWRLSYSLRKLQEQGVHCWQSMEFWFDRGPTKQGRDIDFQPNQPFRYPTASKALWTRQMFDDLKGFPSIDTGQDIEFEKLMRARGYATPRDRVGPVDCYYIYRWGTGSHHLSSFGPGGYAKIGKQPVRACTYKINPRLIHDYASITRNLAVQWMVKHGA